MLGRFRVTNLNGDANGDGVFEEIYCVGSRSFSIIDANTRNVVFDSGDDFEMITSSISSISPIFNADNENNTLKSRSRAKGPEPEGITIAEIEGRTYAFTTLERVGGIMAYDITNPSQVRFVDYANSRNINTYAGDHGPETIIYIPPTKHNKNRSYLAVANEISGTISIFEVVNNRVRPTSKDWGNGDADGSSLPGKKHAGLNQQRYVTHSDARIIMRWTVEGNNLPDSIKKDSTEFGNQYRSDINHNGRYYFSNRTPDNQRDTIFWKRFIDIGVDGSRIRFDSANYLSILPPDAGPLSRIYFHTTPMDAALVLHYLAGRVPSLPWIWDTIPTYGKVVESGPPITIREIQRDVDNEFVVYALFANQDKTQALSFSLNGRQGMKMISTASALYNSEYASNNEWIHYAGSENYHSNIPILTFSMNGVPVESLPMLINDKPYNIVIDKSVSSVDESFDLNLHVTQKTDGVEVQCSDIGGLIVVYDNLGRIFHKAHVTQPIMFIPSGTIESGVYHIVHTLGNQSITEKFIILK
jgi:hypothetical protein